MRFLSRSILALFLAAVTLGLLAVAGFTLRDAVQTRMAERDVPRMARERVVATRVIPFVEQSVTPVMQVFGEVRAPRTLDLRMPAGGRIVRLAEPFEDGAPIAAGALVAELDTAEARAALALARADLDRARADQAEARAAVALAIEDVETGEEQTALRQAALDRARDLANRGVGTEAAVEAAGLALSAARQAELGRRQALAQARARADQAEAAVARQALLVEDAQRRLDDRSLHAPFAGLLGDASATAGGVVAANERIARLIDPAVLEVAFRVSTAQYLRLLDAAGNLHPAEVTVTLDPADGVVQGRGVLHRVDPEVGTGGTGRRLHARLGPVAGLMPGDFVAVTLEEPELEGIARLPAAALGADGMVLVLGPDDRLHEAPVELIRRQGDDVLVRAALAGREVVAQRSPLVGAGLRVRPMRVPDDADAGGADGRDAALPSGMIRLDDARRARLLALVEADTAMAEAARARMRQQLTAETVPARLVDRLENRMGG